MILFKNGAGQPVTVNGAQNRDMTTQFFVLKLLLMWPICGFNTYHAARETLEILRETFPGLGVPHFGDQKCLHRSCDFTPLNFFLLFEGYLKSNMYVNKPIFTKGAYVPAKLSRLFGRCVIP